jgi:hypothetical protein
MTTAERTPTEIIAEQRVHGVQVAYRAEHFIKALADAGYVILPREPTQAMTDSPDYVAGNWSRRNWEAILRSAGLDPQ